LVFTFTLSHAKKIKHPRRKRRSYRMTKLANKLLAWPLFVLFALTLSSCGTTNTPSAEPLQTGTVCETQASLVNPNINDSGIGGTGIRVAKNGSNGNSGGGEGGIGGTGVVAGVNKAIFGTGGVGGTGIVGVITGFASICVNGIEVNYDTTTPVWDNGKPSAISQLAVGQVVSVTAVDNGQQMTARGIGVIQAVVGPISAINAATGELHVMGQKINATRIELAHLKLGDWLRVSGHTLAGGEVMPSHVQPLASQANMQAQLRGSVRHVSGKTVLIGDTRVDLSALPAAPSFVNGDELWVGGAWNGQLLQAHEVTINPTLQGLGLVDKIVFEGYIHASSSRSLSLGAQTLVLSDRTQIVGGTSRELVANRRVQVTGRLGADQRIAVDRVEFSRQSRRGSSGKSSNSQEASVGKADDANLVKTRSDDSDASNSGSGSSGSSSSNSGKGSSSSGSGSSGSGSSGSGSSGSGSSGSGSSGSGSSSGSSGSGSSGSGGSGSSGSGSSGKGSSGSGKSSSK
jgi:Domain of unknown function (DUF5666)